MKISVIIPVYNASRFVTKAVGSALEQPETAEVILVEDGSPDDSLAVCENLANKYNKVHLLRHPGGENRGAGASRNLGIKSANYDFIAFLDADDFYLPGRFTITKEVIEANPDCEGVYEAIGMFIEDQEGYQQWMEAKRPKKQIHTVRKRVPPEELGELLIIGGNGSISPNGLVIKKDVLLKSGYINETLRLHEDTEFHIRLAITSLLLPGRLEEPVARWRVHTQNRISAPQTSFEKGQNKKRLWLSLCHWSRGIVSNKLKKQIVDKVLKYYLNNPMFAHMNFNIIPISLRRRSRLIFLFFKCPTIILEPVFWTKLLPTNFSNHFR